MGHLAYLFLQVALLLSHCLAGNPSTHAGCFEAMALPDSIVARMQGRSLPQGADVNLDELRYLRLSYIGYDGREHVGEMVCNKRIADDLLYVFRHLYEEAYPIASMRLIDDFDADDERSMRANNTSCFCYRTVAGSAKLSKHSMGLAVDINPLQNPCVRRRRDGTTTVEPATAKPYVRRRPRQKYMIDTSDKAYRLFRERGFKWGGAWRTVKDYQHFEK